MVGAQKDYSSYNDVWIDPEAFCHILEIYQFPAMFKTADLLDAFTDFSEKGVEIHLVDRTHALAVFSCKSAALHALSLKHPLIRVRRLSNGTKKSKGKALKLAELLQPVNMRMHLDNAVTKTQHS
ncbi:R3H and coiled-coil domain-containing protein 1-like [Megalops cyprinoides]|uniref:R3H and coiled-coil domain-containing protein 1-like n=1 Tax=Megalops cyprinoides TaxID=118141 RepID=UPI001864DAC0|nr:R3H and coiled-coil domain-containing protein 1-like [Megalops cyprinoides]